MLIILVLLFLGYGLSNDDGNDLRRVINNAHIRFYSKYDLVDVIIVSVQCHNCPFTMLFKGVNNTSTSYQLQNMEFALEIFVSDDLYSSDIHLINFEEYGVYTVQVNHFFDITVKTDRKGHNYKTPLYYCFTLTVVYLLYVIYSERLVKSSESSSNSERIAAVDVFRGMDIVLMIFANYGAGQYHNGIAHAVWDGISLADFAFPIFVFIQGITIRISIESTFRKFLHSSSAFKATIETTKKCVKRSVLLMIIMMLVNKTKSFSSMRYLGVLSYLSASGIRSWYEVFDLSKILALFRAGEQWMNLKTVMMSCSCIYLILSLISILDPIIPFVFGGAHWYISKRVAAPNCPVGYTGPGGWSDGGKYLNCTGGIQRYIDMKIIGEEHMYHNAKVRYVYGGQHFECEGLLGMMNAILLCYLGSFISWIFKNIVNKRKRVIWLATIGCLLLYFGGVLCGFKQYDGYMPLNKNKWNTSFIFVTSGTAFLVFDFVYILVDLLHIWSGFPFKAVGMNSILIYILHEFLHGYVPFTYSSLFIVINRYTFENQTHWTEMINCYILGCGTWIIIANELKRQNLFLKI